MRMLRVHQDCYNGFNRSLAGTIGNRRTERVNIDLANNHVEGGP